MIACSLYVPTAEKVYWLMCVDIIFNSFVNDNVLHL